MSYKRLASFTAIAVILITVAIIVVALVTAFLVNPGLVKGIARKIQGTATASKEPEVAGKYVVKGTSDSSTILVKFKDNASQAVINSIHTKTRTKTKSKIDKINVRVVTLAANAAVGPTIDALKKYKEVEFAEPNFISSASFVPNDQYYKYQWGLPKMAAPIAFDWAKDASGPIAAVVDTGILSTHPDLSGEVLSGYNFVNNTTNAVDDNGHGTHVAGIIGAVSNNQAGVASIGYKSSLLPVKVLDSSGYGYYSAVASGIIYASDKGAKVINLSLGGGSASTTLQNAVNYANSKGVFVVAAAGNSASSAPLYPAACNGAIAISATDSNDNLASFSSYGKNVFSGAPGVSIYSTFLSNSYRYLSGTSMATPQFSGLMELSLGYSDSAKIGIGKTDMLNLVKSTSDKVGGFAYDSTGWNQYFGYGRINAGKLIAALKAKAPAPAPSVVPSPSATPSVSATPSPTPVVSVTPPRADKFNVVLSGTIDYISLDKKLVRLKIITFNNSTIKIKPRNIIDLYLTSSTQIKRKGKTIPVSSLAVGNRLSNIKALYADNALTALMVIAQ